MATPNVGILTTAGKALIDKVNSGQAKISFSKIVFSSMDNSQLSDTQVKALTAIAPQEVVVSSPETTLDTNSGETRIRATGTNEKLADGVYVKTYGVFAKDDTGSEILYGVTVSPNPNYFPAYDGVTPQAVTYSYKTVIQETSNITMTNSNDVYASQEDLTEALQPYAKTVDVNQQLDKKVNVSDMRKPASDVAGIEEVNAKQDKIGYTPADDSKVLHNSGLATMPTDNSGLVVGNNGDIGLVKQNGYSGAFGVGAGNTFHVVQSNHSSIGIADTFHDMFRVNGNYQISLGPGAYFTPADNSKVPHLSGANNFDTVPTVNNNPLLLTSSLPSDLARTGSNQEFTGKNTFDTAPIDKTTGNPYITKDGVPTVDLSSYAKTSDVTTAISTATANMVDSTKATNFTAGLQSGGVDVATAADIKSIEASAWRELDNKYVQTVTGATVSPNTTILYKVDDVNKKLYIQGSVLTMSQNLVKATVNLNSIVKTVTGGHVHYLGLKSGYSNWNLIDADIITPTSIVFSLNNGTAGIVNDIGNGSLSYITYDELV